MTTLQETIREKWIRYCANLQGQDPANFYAASHDFLPEVITDVLSHLESKLPGEVEFDPEGGWESHNARGQNEMRQQVLQMIREIKGEIPSQENGIVGE